MVLCLSTYTDLPSQEYGIIIGKYKNNLKKTLFFVPFKCLDTWLEYLT